jgi:hypothetical protein
MQAQPFCYTLVLHAHQMWPFAQSEGRTLYLLELEDSRLDMLQAYIVVDGEDQVFKPQMEGDFWPYPEYFEISEVITHYPSDTIFGQPSRNDVRSHRLLLYYAALKSRDKLA